MDNVIIAIGIVAIVVCCWIVGRELRKIWEAIGNESVARNNAIEKVSNDINESVTEVSNKVDTLEDEKERFYGEVRSDMKSMSSAIETLCNDVREESEDNRKKASQALQYYEERTEKTIKKEIGHFAELILSKIDTIGDQTKTNTEDIKTILRSQSLPNE